MAENVIVQAVPLREQVADIVRVKILKGELKSDESVSERFVSQMLNVSTTPVKEAFRILQSEGLIYSIPRKGSYVSPLSKGNMEQITYIRSSLEGVAAYYAAINATDEEIAQMGEILNQVGKLLSDLGKRQKVSDGNVEFHRILRNASRNHYLLGLLSTMRSIDNSLRTVNMNLSRVDPVHDHQEHLRIFDAVKRRDSALAEQAIISHIRRVASFVLEKE